MGMISTIARGLFLRGGAVRRLDAGTRLTNALTPDATRQLELGHEAFIATQDALASEYRHGRAGWFDACVNGLNRLPRPMLALGTLGLFIYAMVEPGGFAQRMQGLAYVPEPLWWLLGAIVAFYFGARETHYLREHRDVGLRPLATLAPERAAPAPNPALQDWHAAQRNPGPADIPWAP